MVSGCSPLPLNAQPEPSRRQGGNAKVCMGQTLELNELAVSTVFVWMYGLELEVSARP